jgi:hypothetical protein
MVYRVVRTPGGIEVLAEDVTCLRKPKLGHRLRA